MSILKAKEQNILLEEILGNVENLEGFEVLEEKTADSSTEKHVPFIIETEEGYIVKVGETTAHPMTEAHYIQFIELYVDDYVLRKYLKPTDKPEAEFKTTKGTKVFAKEYCNLHGLWKSKS